MTKFNITNSTVEQLNDTGNNYKFVGSAGNITLPEQVDTAQTAAAENKVEPGTSKTRVGESEADAIEQMPFRPYKRFVPQSFGLVEYHSHVQKAVFQSDAEESASRTSQYPETSTSLRPRRGPIRLCTCLGQVEAHPGTLRP
jgi:hypothetical protein